MSANRTYSFDETRSADLVLAAMEGAEDARLRQVMESVVRQVVLQTIAT